MTKQAKTFGKYEILGELGRGGFATVYRAKDTTLGREVALKLLDPSRTWEPGFVERFYQEARVVARLKHPNIITIHEIGEVDEQLFIAMELVSGGSLQDRLKQRGAMGNDETVTLLMPVASALDFAHANGVVHRDVKPGNILLDQDPNGGFRPVLTDFGLVKALSQSTELTQSGAILGTVEYMAPEQADGDRRDEIGGATDTYSLGIVSYHMLTGQVPFTGSTIEVLMAHANKQPPSPIELRSDLSPKISDTILKALAKQPEDRFATASGFVQALDSGEATDQIVEIPPVPAPPESVPTESDVTEDFSTPTARENGQKVEPKSKGRLLWWLMIPIILFVAVFAYVVFFTDTFYPQILQLSYNPHNPAPDDDITILWRTENAQRVVIWPLGLEFTASDGKGNMGNGISENTELTVIALNWLGEDKQTLLIEVDEEQATAINCGNADVEIADFDRQNDCIAVIEKTTGYIDAGCLSTSLLVNRGSCYGEQSEFDLALQDFANAIEIDPNDPWSYISRSEIYEKMGEQELRLADFNKAIEVAPGDPQTYFHRAEYYEDKGDWQTAIDDITKAIQLSPAVPDYYDGRGLIHERNGNVEAAAVDYEKFLEMSIGLNEFENRRAEVEAWLEDHNTPQAAATPMPISQPTRTPTSALKSVPANIIITSDTMILTEPVEMEFVLVHAGEQSINNDQTNGSDAADIELLQHAIDMFYIGKYEVTNAQYQTFVIATSHHPPSHWINELVPPGKEEHPVVYVNWYDAMAFTDWLTEETSMNFQLPSTGSWQKACQGSDGRTYPWGDEPKPNETLANFSNNVGDTTKVGRYANGASPYNVMDMAGNVWEWTSSIKRGFERILSGGSFNYDEGQVRCDAQISTARGNFNKHIGFRVVMSP